MALQVGACDLSNGDQLRTLSIQAGRSDRWTILHSACHDFTLHNRKHAMLRIADSSCGLNEQHVCVRP